MGVRNIKQRGLAGKSSEEGNLTRSEIESILMKAADLIRTRVDYKYILILLFLKRLSDKWEIEYQEAYNEALEDGLSEKRSAEAGKLSTARASQREGWNFQFC